VRKDVNPFSISLRPNTTLAGYGEGHEGVVLLGGGMPTLIGMACAVKH